VLLGEVSDDAAVFEQLLDVGAGEGAIPEKMEPGSADLLPRAEPPVSFVISGRSL
jgi:hypothetical protein